MITASIVSYSNNPNYVPTYPFECAVIDLSGALVRATSHTVKVAKLPRLQYTKYSDQILLHELEGGWLVRECFRVHLFNQLRYTAQTHMMFDV